MIFDAFERMVAFRYLRARRAEGFVSVIAIFSLLGIALGVATLIIVMSVMNGFRADLLGRILGLNGDLGVYAPAGSLGDFAAAAQKVRQVPGVNSIEVPGTSSSLTIDQELPFHCSSKDPSPVVPSPAAMQKVGLAQETAAILIFVPADGVGMGTIDHAVPFHVSPKGCS